MFSAQSEMLTALRFAPKQRDETGLKAPAEPEAAGLDGFGGVGGGRGSLTRCGPAPALPAPFPREQLTPGSGGAGVHVSLFAERSAGSSALGEGPPGPQLPRTDLGSNWTSRQDGEVLSQAAQAAVTKPGLNVRSSHSWLRTG